MKNYDNIINLPHHTSEKHTPMPIADRAAQFSSFAALKGYGEAVEEAARFTDGKVELAEDKQAELDVKLGILSGILHDRPQIAVTYFKPDGNKDGGSYLTKRGALAKIDGIRREIIFTDGCSISADLVTDICGDELDRLYYGA